jgi:hypothetical protein
LPPVGMEPLSGLDASGHTGWEPSAHTAFCLHLLPPLPLRSPLPFFSPTTGVTQRNTSIVMTIRRADSICA